MDLFGDDSDGDDIPPRVDSPPPEESEFRVFATSNPRMVEAPALWLRDQVAKKACRVDDRRVVKDAGSFGDSTLTRFFPLVEGDETLPKVPMQNTFGPPRGLTGTLPSLSELSHSSYEGS